MPGQSFDVPGASLGDGYMAPPAPGAEAALDGALAATRAALDERAEREAGLPADPGIINVRNSIRHEYEAAAGQWAARKRSHYQRPDRARYTPEGLRALDQEFETTLAADRDAMAGRLGQRLDVVERAVLERSEDANTIPVGREDDDRALRFAATLSHTTPRNGGQLLADFVAEAAEHPAIAYSALPLLRSAHDRGDWRGDWELARAIEMLQRVVEARPGAARAAADLQLIDETRRQLGHLDDAAWVAPLPRYVLDQTGHEVPAPGTAGFALEWSGSPDARRLFGAGPSLSGTEQLAPATSNAGDGAWVRSRGILRGRAPHMVEDE